jgi:hypothetical protein
MLTPLDSLMNSRKANKKMMTTAVLLQIQMVMMSTSALLQIQMLMMSTAMTIMTMMKAMTMMVILDGDSRSTNMGVSKHSYPHS